MKQLTFPLLRRGMVYLKHSQRRVWVPMSECIEPGAEQNVLGGSALDRLAQQVLGVAAAGNHEGPHSDRVWPRFPVREAARSTLQLRGIRSQDAYREGVFEHKRVVVVELVRCAAKRYPERRPRRLRRIHLLASSG